MTETNYPSVHNRDELNKLIADLTDGKQKRIFLDKKNNHGYIVYYPSEMDLKQIDMPFKGKELKLSESKFKKLVQSIQDDTVEVTRKENTLVLTWLIEKQEETQKENGYDEGEEQDDEVEFDHMEETVLASEDIEAEEGELEEAEEDELEEAEENSAELMEIEEQETFEIEGVELEEEDLEEEEEDEDEDDTLEDDLYDTEEAVKDENSVDDLEDTGEVLEQEKNKDEENEEEEENEDEKDDSDEEEGADISLSEKSLELSQLGSALCSHGMFGVQTSRVDLKIQPGNASQITLR